MVRQLLIGLAAITCIASPARPAATLGDSAKALIGTWEFSNADRDRICNATFKGDPVRFGFKVEFDASCAEQFPLVKEVAGWTFPEGDLLRLVDQQGRTLVEFSEVEDGIYEAPTPGVGVLFLQSPAAAGPPPKSPEEVAGTYAITRANGTSMCTVTLTTTAVQDVFVMSMKQGCDATMTRLNFNQWRIDRGELTLMSTRGITWRFEANDNGTWRKLPESADAITLVRQ